MTLAEIASETATIPRMASVPRSIFMIVDTSKSIVAKIASATPEISLTVAASPKKIQAVTRIAIWTPRSLRGSELCEAVGFIGTYCRGHGLGLALGVF